MVAPEDNRVVGEGASLAEVGTFYRDTTNARAEKKSRPTWVDSYKPSKTRLDRIRLLRANYHVEIVKDDALIKVATPWFPWVEHFHGTRQQGTVCSAGPWRSNKKKKQPCCGCDHFWSGMHTNPQTGKRERGYMGMRDMNTFSVIHYWPYHEVEQIDNEGHVRVGNQGKPFTEWVQCEGVASCPHCIAQKPRTPAHKLHWDLGRDHFDRLMNKDRYLATCCKNCGGRNTITWEAYVCGNKSCEHPFFVNGETSVKPEEIEKQVSKGMLCPVCGIFEIPTQYITCTCGTPVRMGIFDVEMQVKRSPVANGIGTELVIEEWQGPFEVINLPPEIAANAELAESFATPLNLPTIFKPTSYSEQVAKFGNVGAPQGDIARTPVTSDYNR